MPADPVDVVWEVATDDRFTAVVARGVATAEPDLGHSVHVEAGGLDPGDRLPLPVHAWASGRARWAAPAPWPPPARCRTGSPWPSPTASCSTPAATPPTATCSTRTSTWSSTWATTSTSTRRARALPAPHPREPRRLAPALRVLPRDADLRAAHARFPFVCTWDDHEVRNNYMGDTVPDGRPPRRRPGAEAAAYQALVGEPAGPARPRPTAPTWPSTSTSTSVTWPACTCSTSARTPTRRPAATTTPPRRLRRLRRPHRRGPHPPRPGPGGLVRRRDRRRAARRGTSWATRWCWPASTPGRPRARRLLPRHVGRLPRRPASR